MPFFKHTIKSGMKTKMRIKHNWEKFIPYWFKNNWYYLCCLPIIILLLFLLSK